MSNSRSLHSGPITTERQRLSVGNRKKKWAESKEISGRSFLEVILTRGDFVSCTEYVFTPYERTKNESNSTNRVLCPAGPCADIPAS